MRIGLILYFGYLYVSKRQTMKQDEYIELDGVRVNNLKNISVKIPRNKLVVISGLSGSGKSSLAFDTLYAEGQRRYVESLSVYARQFVSKMKKPEADHIIGIPPAIAIQQRITNRSPRSTVGTTSEVYDYLRMFFARVGHTFSPVSGEEVKRQTTADVSAFIGSLPAGEAVMICAPMFVPRGRPLADHLQLQLANGYVRILKDGEAVRISDFLERKSIDREKKSGLYLVIDRVRADAESEATLSRIGDSVETAFFEGRGECLVKWTGGEKVFNDRFEADGITFEEPTDKLFSFNSSVGACPTCEGYSMVMGIDEDRVIADKSLSLYEECVLPWRGPKMSMWQKRFIADTAGYDFPVHRPYKDLTEEQKALLWDGIPGEVYGINAFFKHLEQNTHKMHFRIMLARFRGKSTCPTCKGKRLRKEAFYVKVGGKDIGQLVEMPVSELRKWFEDFSLPEEDFKAGERLLGELRRRIGFLDDIGLGYLKLNRVAGTLSGGESQRIALAKSLSGGLIGSLYVLDEPTTGLHPRDTHLLIDIMRRLTDAGNTVVVVEHDEEVIRSADLVIDIGPEAGEHGGEIVYYGTPGEMAGAPKGTSYTVEYLTGRLKLPTPKRRTLNHGEIEIKGGYKNNLKDIDVQIPLRAITVVTGVSGSGKSTLMRDILYESVRKQLNHSSPSAVGAKEVLFDLNKVQNVEYVDQDALGKSTRSNPVTYIGAYDLIRDIMSLQPLSKQMGYTAQYFSFNKEGGRCEYCKGEGVITVEMQFMADLQIECEECHGKRFQDEILEVTYNGKNIYDILEMTVNEAVDFFRASAEAKVYPETIAESVAQSLGVLQDVGLGYVRLGQNSSSLSGGETQRLKLASYLQGENKKSTLFIFDEPTTGLHTNDIKVLMDSFNALIRYGHTVVIVEHNLTVIKCADFVIDLGPEGGDKDGGHVVYSGPLKGLLKAKGSYTAKYLAAEMERE